MSRSSGPGNSDPDFGDAIKRDFGIFDCFPDHFADPSDARFHAMMAFGALAFLADD